MQAVLALVLVLWTFVLPETPRWLIKNGFKLEGLGALADLHGTGDTNDPKIIETYSEIEAAIEFEAHLGQATWGQLFKQYTRRTVMGITCQLFAQFNVLTAILYFLPSNLSRAGFSMPMALLYTGISALVYCAGTIPAMFLIDKWGRRTFLLGGSIGLAAFLATVGAVQYHSNTLPVGPARVRSADGIFAGKYSDTAKFHIPTPFNSCVFVSLRLWS